VQRVTATPQFSGLGSRPASQDGTCKTYEVAIRVAVQYNPVNSAAFQSSVLTSGCDRKVRVSGRGVHLLVGYHHISLDKDSLK